MKPVDKTRLVRLAICVAAGSLAACGGGGGGGEDTPPAPVGPVATKADAVRAASVALGLYEALDPNVDPSTSAFVEPRFTAKSKSRRKSVPAKVAEVRDCDISGKRSDDPRTENRTYTLFGNGVVVDSETEQTSFNDCKEEYFAADQSSGNLTRKGLYEFGSGLDDEADSYTHVKFGNNGVNPALKYTAKFDELNDATPPQVVNTFTYEVSGLVENGSFIDRVESRVRNLAVKHTQKLGNAASTSLQATLGTASSSLVLVRDDEGRVSIDGPIEFSSSVAGCVGGAVLVDTVTPLVGDAGFTAGEMTLSSMGVTTRLKFNANGSVDVTVGNAAAQNVSAAEFAAAVENSGC